MKKNIEKIISIPEGFDVKINKNIIEITGEGKKAEREIYLNNVEIHKTDDKIKLKCEKATKRESKIIGTVAAHIRNMFRGLKDDFAYKLEVCNIHFPMTVKVEGKRVVIKNFLGEKTERAANILENVKVEVKGKEITVKSQNKESAGQTAANIERATKIKGRDRRVFQDGIFITEKSGEAI